MEGVLVGLIGLLCAAWVLRLWRADLSIPLRYAPVDDTKFYLMLVKGIVDHGSYLSNPSLGAPFGQQLSDFPQGADNLNLLIIRVLAVFSSNAALIVNLFFLLTFALASFTSHLVLRSLGIGARAAGVVSVLFSLLAYHFFRGESHLLLSAYYAVPLSIYLFLRLLGGDPLFARRARPRYRWAAWLSPRTLGTLAICVFVGSENLYYATFATVMLLAGGLITLLAGRWRSALCGLGLVALVAASVLANLSPTLVYRAEHGTNAALERSAAFTESSGEAFSLRLADLLLPAPDSHIGPLRALAATYDHTIAPGYCEACYASLGTVGTVGFIWLTLGALATLLGAAGWLAARRLGRYAALGVVAALAVSTVGGLASLIEVFVTPDIRAWNRMSVLIAFLCLLGVSLLLEALLRRLRPLRWGGVLGSLSLLAIMVFGVYDQTSDSFVPGYAATARQWDSDQRFVAGIQKTLPRGASVFQLPYVPFPEGYPETPVGDQIATYSTKYELPRGYLHSSTLRWSYGAMKGRASDWPAQLDGQPLPYVVAAVSSAGFDGLWVDPAGFEQQKALELRASLERLLGAGRLSPLGDLWFFDLRPYAARLRRTRSQTRLSLLRERTLHPLRIACTARGLTLLNPTALPQQATLIAHVMGAGKSARSALPPDGQASDIPEAQTVTIRRRLLIEPGQSVLRLGAAGAPQGAFPQVLYATLTADPLLGFAHVAGLAASTLVPGLTGPPCSP